MALVAATLTLAGCGGGAPGQEADAAEPVSSAQVRILTQEWGEVAGGEPVELHAGRVVEGQVFTIDAVGVDLHLTFVDIDQASVVVETSRVMLPYNVGSTEPIELEQEFTATVDRPIEISTPSLDSGTNVTIVLETQS